MYAYCGTKSIHYLHAEGAYLQDTQHSWSESEETRCQILVITLYMILQVVLISIGLIAQLTLVIFNASVHIRDVAF